MAVTARKAHTVAAPPVPPVATPCTRSTVRCPDATRYDRALPPCCRGHVKLITSTIAGMFNTYGVTYWADYGTLLGAVRNPLTTWADYPWLPQQNTAIPPGIIPHDKDADFGVLFSQWALVYRIIRRAAAAHRFDTVVRLQRGTMKVRLSRLNHTNLDMFFWLERKDHMYFRKTYATVDECKGKVFHRDQVFPLGKVRWEGLTLPAPRDPQTFLEFRYGADWRTPVMANHDGVKRP